MKTGLMVLLFIPCWLVVFMVGGVSISLLTDYNIWMLLSFVGTITGMICVFLWAVSKIENMYYDKIWNAPPIPQELDPYWPSSEIPNTYAHSTNVQKRRESIHVIEEERYKDN